MSLFKAEVILEKPGELPKTLWTGEAILPDEATRERFTLKTLGSIATRYADDHDLKITPPPPEDRSRNWIELLEVTGEGFKCAATLRLCLTLTTDKDGWLDKPNVNGLWWYITKNGEGEEVLSIALIELEDPYPVRAILGSDCIFKFEEKMFIGPWKKAVVPQPAGWLVEYENPVVVSEK